MAVVVYKGHRSPSLSATITLNGAAYDLTTASSVKLQARALNSQTLAIDRAATVVTAASGIVRLDWEAADVANAGEFVAWWLVTLANGTTQPTDEFLLTIRPPLGSATALVEVAEVRELLLSPDDHTNDALIEAEIAAVSALIESYTGREFTPTEDTTRRFFYHAPGWLSLAPYDLRSATSVVLDPDGTSPLTLTAGTDYRLGPIPARDGVYEWLDMLTYNPPDVPGSATAGRLVDVTGDWGFAAVPDTVRKACRTQVALWLRRSVFTYASAWNIDEGRIERPDALDFGVRRMLDPYRRRGIS